MITNLNLYLLNYVIYFVDIISSNICILQYINTYTNCYIFVISCIAFKINKINLTYAYDIRHYSSIAQ